MSTVKTYTVLLRRCELGAHGTCSGSFGIHLRCDCKCHTEPSKDDD